jgi:hypothetical protein
MTAAAVSHPRRISASQMPLWPSVVVFVALLGTFCVYLVVTLSSNTSSTPAGPATKGHHAGGQYNQICVPAPSTRYC